MNTCQRRSSTWVETHAEVAVRDAMDLFAVRHEKTSSGCGEVSGLATGIACDMLLEL